MAENTFFYRVRDVKFLKPLKVNSGIKAFFLKPRITSDTLFLFFKNILLLFFLIVTLYPFINIVALSLNDAQDSILGGIRLWPRKFSIDNYIKIFKKPVMFTATLNTFLRVTIGMITSVISSSMIAYILSVKEFVFRKVLNFLYVFTMYVSGSIIPTYFLYKNLGLINNFNLYWIALHGISFYLIVVRTYIYGIPRDILEAAQIEGASHNAIYWRIILPLCKPVLACIALFAILEQWNMWFDTYLYSPKITTLQYELQRMIQIAKSRPPLGPNVVRTPAKVIEAAMSVITALPMIIIYIIFQKYFVTGLTLGGVKG